LNALVKLPGGYRIVKYGFKNNLREKQRICYDSIIVVIRVEYGRDKITARVLQLQVHVDISIQHCSTSNVYATVVILVGKQDWS